MALVQPAVENQRPDAGEREAAHALLDAAAAQDRREPTYYGSALVALTRVTLDTELLGACA